MLGRLSAFVGSLKRPSVLSTTSVGVVNGNNQKRVLPGTKITISG